MKAYELGLIEARSEISAGRLSAGELVQSCLARATAVEPVVGAFAWLDPEAVLSALAPTTAGPLAGIPVGVKDIIATAGIPTEMGSAAYKGHVPAQSAWVVEALAKAGAVVLGKTVTTEFAWRHPGKTRNPWNPDHTPGGSSSGSAAAVACGSVAAALGTQTLGSIVRPAAFCGVVGFKPSFGTIPRTGVHPFAPSLDHLGVFTRNVSDAAFFCSQLFGQDGVDFPNFAAPQPAWPLAALARPPRIALVHTAAWDRVSAQQQALVESTARQLEAAGAQVTIEVLPPAFDKLWKVAQFLADAEGAFANQDVASQKPLLVSEPTQAMVQSGRTISALVYLQAKADQAHLARLFDSFSSSFDAVLTAPALGEAPQGLANTGDAALCTPFTLVGAPAITLPAARTANGLPLGIQLVGRWSRDQQLLNVALWVEQQLAYKPGFPMSLVDQ
ncbi:MAG: amidase [Bdellovibrionales bacterium]|nr:amidase [Ramlibacter sp.]